MSLFSFFSMLKIPSSIQPTKPWPRQEVTSSSSSSSSITRIEIIDSTGRIFVKYLDKEVTPKFSYQDFGTTLKIFL